MVVNTIYGWNPCGPLGPTTTDAIFAFDLTDVSTLVPYTDVSATSRRSTRQLHLSDLALDCSTAMDTSSLATNTHPMKNDDVRCNPALIIPPEIKSIGLPYWQHCGNVGNRFGLFDPPYAMPTLEGLFPVTTTSAAVDPSVAPHTSAATGPTAIPDLPSNTDAVPQPTATTAVSEPTPETTIKVAPPVSVPVEASLVAAPTVPQQVVSLGTAGFEVVHSEGAVPSTYVVPAIGATKAGVGVAPASVVVYQGQTLTAGGAAATVMNPVVVVPSDIPVGTEGPTGGDNATSTTSPVYAASAGKLLGNTVCLGAGFLIAVLMF